MAPAAKKLSESLQRNLSILDESDCEILYSLVEKFAEQKKIAASQNNAEAIRKFRAIVGNDIPWKNEEEMIAELAEMRRGAV